jgi:hypothetical protein
MVAVFGSEIRFASVMILTAAAVVLVISIILPANILFFRNRKSYVDTKILFLLGWRETASGT